MNTERMREEFEVWSTANGISIVRTNQALMFANGQRRAIGDYIMVESVCAWAAWQASRVALVIELPDASEYREWDGDCTFINSAEYTQAIKEAIESLGLKVKP